MYCSLVRNGSTAWVTGSSSMFWHIYILTRLSCIIFSNTPIFHHPYVLSFDTHGYVPIPICCFTCRHQCVSTPLYLHLCSNSPYSMLLQPLCSNTPMFLHPYHLFVPYVLTPNTVCSNSHIFGHPHPIGSDTLLYIPVL